MAVVFSFSWDPFDCHCRGAVLPSRTPRIHTFDVYNNALSEAQQAPCEPATIFRDLEIGPLDGETRKMLSNAETAFASLQHEAKLVLRDMLDRTVWSGEDYAGKKSLPFSRHDVETVRTYFVFLRFRNSRGYRDIVASLEAYYRSQPGEVVYAAFRPLVGQARLRHVLRGFIRFLTHSSEDAEDAEDRGAAAWRERDAHPAPAPFSIDAFYEVMETYCWSLCEAEVCIGVATEDQEFMLSDRCFGTLDEGFDEDPYVHGCSV